MDERQSGQELPEWGIERGVTPSAGTACLKVGVMSPEEGGAEASRPMSDDMHDALERLAIAMVLDGRRVVTEAMKEGVEEAVAGIEQQRGAGWEVVYPEDAIQEVLVFLDGQGKVHRCVCGPAEREGRESEVVMTRRRTLRVVRAKMGPVVEAGSK